MKQKSENLRLLALCPTLLMLACGGHTVLGEDASGQGGQGTGGQQASGGHTGGGWVSEGEVSGGHSSGGQSTGGTSATCAQPAGDLYLLATTEDFYAALVGSWQICSGKAAFAAAPDDVIGVEYGAPSLVETENQGSILRGNMYYLVAGVNGPERGAGFDYQLTYDVSPQGERQPPQQLNMHPAPNSGFGGSFRYSASPPRWEISGGSVNPSAKAILAPFE